MKLQTVIVGGGIVGTCLALKLAQDNKKVILIDPRAKKTTDDWLLHLQKRDSRVFALNPASIKLLKSLGVWKFLTESKRHVDYTGMHVWQLNGKGDLTFSAPNDTEILGSMVEPRALEYALHKRMGERDVAGCIEVLTNTVTAIEEQFNVESKQVSYTISLDNNATIIANLLVGADGRNSSVRKFANINIDILKYHQTAISCAIKTEKPHDFTARQAMLPTGTLALLPLADVAHTIKTTDTPDGFTTQFDNSSQSDNWQSVVWTLSTNKAHELLATGSDNIRKELAFASNYELGNIIELESLNSFPLVAQHVKTYVKPKLVLIGDAAHSIHPLAGQGLNLGLADVESLSKCLIGDFQRSHGKQWAHMSTLKKYERERYALNSQMMHGCSAINWMFASKFAQGILFEQARAEGMNFVGNNRTLSSWFNKQASGLSN